MKTAQIHRFGDCVALYVSKGETIYITPKQAKELAKAINACANDCTNNKYLDGVFKTTELSFVDTGHNGTGYKISRKVKALS